MRGSAPVFLAALIAVAGTGAAVALDGECVYDVFNELVCTVSGEEPGDDTGKDTAKEPLPRPPIRYLYLDPVDNCHYFSRIPGGIDAWDPANEYLVYDTVLGTPECEPDADRAWEVFRSFPLAVPAPSFQPAEHGITGLPTYLAAANPAPIIHSEVLEDGRVFEVRALVATLTVNWGDGATTTEDPTYALPYPEGGFTHTYTTKTCPPDYRVTHPSGQNCHATLEAYPVTATYTWWGEYRVGGAWLPIGTLDLTTTARYDVDEVVGVLVDP